MQKTGEGWRKSSLSMICALTLLFCFAPFAQIAKGSVTENQQNVSQLKTLRGVVVDELGEVLIGVSVSVKGGNVGAITGVDGSFSLAVPANAKELEFSYIGYTPQTVAIGNKTDFAIQMQSDTQLLDEVVVIGYGTIKKRDLTGSVASIKGEDLVLNPGSNPMEALQGKVAGFDITRESGQAGAGVNMVLRGTKSIEASKTPLFIIDGLPGDYATLNPNDIESVEILKDASSTAIYGSKGATGVVIITTKSAKAGKTRVNFNAYVGVNGWSTLPEMRSGESYIQALRDANQATGNWSSTADDERLFASPAAYQAHLDGKYLNWAELLMQNNLTQNYSISISGGTEKTKAYLSLNFSDEQGQYKGDEYKVYSTNMKIDHTLNDWLSIGTNAQMSYVHQNKAYARLMYALRSVPLGEAYDADGNINVSPVEGDQNVINLLLNERKGVYKNQNQNFKLYFNPYIQVNPLKGLTFRSQLGAALTYSRANYFQGEGSYNYYNTEGPTASGTNSSVFATVTDNRRYNYKWENILTYNFNINKEHEFTLTGVTSWAHNRYDHLYLKQDNITDNKYLWHNILSSTSSTGETDYTMSKEMAFIGRVNYSYLGKYLLAASIRHEGMSVLAEGNKWSTFPAVSAGWRISDEAFMEDTRTWMDNLKLRVGWGMSGCADIDPYSSSSNLDQKYYTLGGSQVPVYLFSEIYTNKNLTWEKVYTTNIGLDAGFLKNRIEVIMDFYTSKTDGAIYAKALPIINGGFNASTYYKALMNLGETKNTGFELTLNTRNVATRDFKWDTALTFSWNEEKLEKLIDGVSDHIPYEDFHLSLGHPIKSYYQLKKTGIWQKGEEADAEVFTQSPGDIKIDIPDLYRESEGKYYKIDEETGEKIYYDKDNKYAIGDKDRQVIGHNTPDWMMGFKNTFTYRDFDLSIFAQVRWGQMINYEMLGFYDPKGEGNFPTYFDYWTENNPSNDFPAINSSKQINNYTGYSALNYVDGSFIKIKNITLGYTLPAHVAKAAKIQNCRFYATISNPFVFAKSHLLENYDPEMNGDVNYPLTKQLVFGVNLTF
ncbi:TonB-dependent receptor [Bacteroidales bacterium OttesenSCG-928-L03]|nr:TonB-dependent receptor [Bacteroidales bacterium OttesenSCG-928-L03]